MKTILSLTSAAMISLFAFGQSKENKSKDTLLVYKVFTVEMTEQGTRKKVKIENDVISFKLEKLNSNFMTTVNKFPPAPYTAEMDFPDADKSISFESTGENSDGEVIQWTGTVVRNEIEGTAQISQKGKTKKEYYFTGTLKTKWKKK